MKKDGKLRTVAYDNLARDWQRKCESVVGLPDKLLKGLRKTGSTTLKSNVQYGWLRALYLGNIGKIADKHYDANDGRIYPSFDEAVTWLGEQFRRPNRHVPH